MSRHATLLRPSAAALALVLAACSGGEQAASPGGPGGGAPQAPTVSVQTVESRSVDLAVTLPGRVTASRVSEVRPQVGGLLTERLFEEGQRVSAGDELYSIDSAPYEAAVAQAKAQLAQARAQVTSTTGREERFGGLVESGAVSRQDYDDAVAAAQDARAQVALAEAALQRAQIDLDRTTITAPIDGKIGRSLVTEGALVAAGQPDPLAVITQLDPIYVDVARSSAEILRWKRALAAGELSEAEGDALPVRLTLEDGSTYDAEGRLALQEVSVEPGSGSVTLRAVFPNPDEILMPGMFVRAEITEGVNEDAVLVPQAAVSRSPQGQGLVFVLGENDTVAAQPIETVRAMDGQWVVRGLEPGTRIVTDGFGRFQPGQTVNPEPARVADAGADAR